MAFDIVGIGSLNFDYIVEWSRISGPRRRQLKTVLEETETVTSDFSAFLRALQSASDRSSVVIRGHGGSAFNTIRAVAKMDVGLRLGFVGVLGRPPDESQGFDFERTMHDSGIDSNGLLRIRGSGTASLSLVSASGDRDLHTYYNEAAASRLHEACSSKRLIRYVARARHVHISSIFGKGAAKAILALLRAAQGEAATPISVSVDPGLDWAQRAHADPSIRGILKLAGHIFVNERELRHLGTPAYSRSDIGIQALDNYGGPNVRAILLKEFDRSHVLSKGEPRVDAVIEQAVIPVGRIADATGAGDVFAAGVLAGIHSQRGRELGGSALGLRAARRKLQFLGDAGYEALTRLFEEDDAPPVGPIFISHAYQDQALAQAFVTFLEGLGSADGTTFCTSVLDVGIPAGIPVVTQIYEQLDQAAVVVFLVTKAFLRRRFCRYEVGACWALGKEQIILRDPAIKPESLDLLLRQREAHDITDEAGLRSVHQRLVDMNLLVTKSAPSVNRQIKSFVSSVRANLS